MLKRSEDPDDHRTVDHEIQYIGSSIGQHYFKTDNPKIFEADNYWRSMTDSILAVGDGENISVGYSPNMCTSSDKVDSVL